MRKPIVYCLLFTMVVIGCRDAAAAVYPAMAGTVVDATAGTPVKGATVLVYWTKNIIGFEIGSELIAARLVETDNDGRYHIDGIIRILGPKEFKGDTVLVVYQPGFQVHIEREFPTSNEIKKVGNSIKLERIPANFDHGKHYDEIERVLWGIDDPTFMLLDGPIIWSRAKDSALKGFPEKEILLRRASWEEERARRKYRR